MRRALAVLACPLLLAAAPAKPAAPQAAAGSRGEKMARILSLEDMRSTGDGALDRLLADGDRGVRRRAALAAGRIGDASMAGALVARMNDTEPEVRQMSAFALGLLGDPLAAERLVAALTDADPIVRARSVEALGRVGGPRAAPAIVEAVRAALPPDAPVVTVRGDDPGSASTSFFLVTADAPSLDGKYTAFGRVVDGLAVLDAIEASPVNGEAPVTRIELKTIRIVKGPGA